MEVKTINSSNKTIKNNNNKVNNNRNRNIQKIKLLNIKYQMIQILSKNNYTKLKSNNYNKNIHGDIKQKK